MSRTEDYAFGRYDVEAVQFDQATAANPYLLPVVAAGNDRSDRGPLSGTYRALDADGDWRTYRVEEAPRPPDGGADGFDTLAGAGVAKNVLTVGSVSVDGAGRVGTASWFSSFGPTDDGRVKPDLVAPGEDLLSTLPGSPDAYGYSTGTSMAAPTVAGTALLLQEHAQALRGSHLTAAALKGLLLHTARDLHTPGPDYGTGWGVVDAAAAAERLSAAAIDRSVLHEDVLAHNAAFTHTVTVDDAGPLRVTLSWTDPAGTRRPLRGPSSLDEAAPHLVHDLDVRLVDGEGRVYLPFRLDPAAPAAAARPGDNVVDPVEQVYVPAAQPGPYTIVVSHKGTLAGPQPFAVVVSGAHGDAVPVAVSHLSGETTVDQVVLTWKTRFERAAGTFTVERAPVTYRANGQRDVGTFTDVGEVVVAGDSGGERPYTFSTPRGLAGRYQYRVVFDDGTARFVAGEVEVHVPPPDRRAVVSNYPNPFADRTTVVVDLPRTQHVTVDLFDALGRRLRRLQDGELSAGRHYLAVDAAGWAPGLYFARVTTPGAVLTHRMVVVR